MVESQVRDAAYWKRWAEERRRQKTPPTVTVPVRHVSDVSAVRKAALEHPRNFAAWPLRLDVPPHHAQWYDISQMYKIDPRYRKVVILAPTGWGKTTVWNLTVPLYEISVDRSIQTGLIGSNLYNVRAKMANLRRQMTDNSDLIRGFGYSTDADPTPRFRPKSRDSKWSTDEIVVAGAFEAARDKGKSLDNPTLAVFSWDSNMEGRHWDLAINDDIVDYVEAQSAVIRAQHLDWYHNVFKQRMNPGGREIWIGTRAHNADLYQELIDLKDYVVIDDLQALMTDPETGLEVSTWPERYTTEELQAEREKNLVAFMLKRMNRIAGRGLTEFQKDEVDACRDTTLRYYGNLHNMPRAMQERELLIYAGVDLATGLTFESKFFVVWVVGVDKKTGDRYLLDLHRGRWPASQQRQAVRDVYERWMPTEIVVENNGTQSYFYEDVLQGLPIRPVNTSNNKVDLGEGIPSLVALVKNRKLHIPWEDAHAQSLSKDVVKELHDYPRGESSDCVMAWWFAERRARLVLFQAAKVDPHRNFLQRFSRHIPIRPVLDRERRVWGHGRRGT